MTDKVGLFDGRQRIEGLEVIAVIGACPRIDIHVADIEGSHILEEMAALRGFDAEVLQTALCDRFRFADISPCHGDTERRNL